MNYPVCAVEFALKRREAIRLSLRRSAALALGSGCFWPGQSIGQNNAQTTAFPQRAVKLIVPNSPGSSIDTIGRILSTHLSAYFSIALNANQNIIVENKAGAAGALGLEVGRAMPADGYALMLASSSSLSVAPLLQKAVKYEPLKDFELIALVALLPNVLVCNASLPVTSMASFVAYAKARPGRINMASAGLGSVSHLAGVALGSAAGFESLHVPYKGGSQSAASVVSGETHWTLTPAPNAMSLVKAGRLKVLGHSMARKIGRAHV